MNREKEKRLRGVVEALLPGQVEGATVQALRVALVAYQLQFEAQSTSFPAGGDRSTMSAVAAQRQWKHSIPMAQELLSVLGLVDDLPSLDSALDVLDLPPRLLGNLRIAGIESIRDLIGKTDIDFLKIPCIGKVSYYLLRDSVRELGFPFPIPAGFSQ